MGLTHEAVERELTKVLCHQERWWWMDGEAGVPVLPELSFQRLHRPVLLLANSPYLARKEGSDGR